MSIYLQLFLTFFRIGLFTFGGGYAMLPLIQDAVLENKWLDSESIINFIAVSESTPGPFAINIATYVGTETGGFFGAVCATLGVVLPSFIVILIIAQFYEKFKNSKIVSGVMTGLRPAVIGLIASALFSIFLTVFFHSDKISFTSIVPADFISSLIIAVIMTILIFKKVHPIIIIVLSAVLGIVSGYLFL